MDDVVFGSLKSASNAQIGDNSGYDKSSLKAYVYESKLKRIVIANDAEIVAYLLSKFAIPNPIKIRIEDSKQNFGKVAYEDFTIKELLKCKLTSFDSKTCIKLWNIYEEKGLHSLLNAIQYLSPIQKI